MKLKCCDWKPVPYTGLHARTKRLAAIGHTNGGGTDNGSLFGFWTQNAKGERGADNLHIGAHFQVKKVGRPEQYVDTNQVIYHAYGASEWAVGIEVEDDSDPSTPMNANQIASIVAILLELKVPAKMLTSVNPGDGVGYHEQFPAWNQSDHACPGTVRTKQWEHVIVPALAAARAPKPKPLARTTVMLLKRLTKTATTLDSRLRVRLRDGVETDAAGQILLHTAVSAMTSLGKTIAKVLK